MIERAFIESELTRVHSNLETLEDRVFVLKSRICEAEEELDTLEPKIIAFRLEYRGLEDKLCQYE